MIEPHTDQRAARIPATRRRSLVPFLILCLTPIGSVSGATAQQASNGAPQAERPVARAAAASEPPTMDGNVLGDPAWREAPLVTGFWQTTPDEGRPATEKTEVRLLYTAGTLYIGVVCYDREPSQIIVTDNRRDASLEEMDSFRLILDTYRDRQNGFLFGTSPAGVEYDAQVSNEGQGEGFGAGARAQSGAGGGLNVNWDGSWTVRVETGPYGWSAEFAIPFRTLRFSGGEQQVWGVNFERTIRRKRETAYWAPLPRQYGLARVSLAGSLEGLEPPSPRNLQVTPYGLLQGTRDVVANAYETSGPDGDFGADLKYSLTPSLTLDATYNTDFAQVEVDEQQINLDRFNLFFPEKRPFFLENAGLFAVGQPGQVELFFSRRIGIGPNGEEVPILAGARVSGDLAGMKVGVLDMQTEEVGTASIAGNNFAVVRAKRELPNRSFVGTLFTNRQGMGAYAADADYNRLAAIDGQLGVGRYGLLSGFAARSFTAGVTDPQHAFRFEAGYDAERWMLEGGYSEIAAGFSPELGFLQRTAYRSFNGLVFYRLRPDVLGFHELRPHSSYNGYWGLDGFYESGRLHVDNHWEWASGYELHTGVNFTHEGVREPFDIVDQVTVATGSYDHVEAELVAMTDQRQWISLAIRATIGGFFGGRRVALSPSLTLRGGDAFNSEFSLDQNDASLPDGNFTANLFRARLSYSFTPRLYVQALLQLNDAADVRSANLRFGWLQTAGTGLVVVYSQTSGFDDVLIPGVDNQTLIVKYSRLFNVLN
jgi:Domain of unknown function (DUF5916)